MAGKSGGRFYLLPTLTFKGLLRTLPETVEAETMPTKATTMVKTRQATILRKDCATPRYYTGFIQKRMKPTLKAKKMIRPGLKTKGKLYSQRMY